MIEYIKKADRYIGRIGIFALFILVGCLLIGPIKGFDIWLHLAVGKFILNSGFVPNTDFLSCTAFGQPWNNHEWLYQIIVSFFHSLGGFKALTILRVILGLSVFALLVSFRKDRITSLVGLSVLSIVFFVYQLRFNFRPDLASLLLFTAYLIILYKHLNAKRTPTVILVLQLIWVNIHGFFILGPVLIGLFVGAQYIPMPGQSSENRESKVRLNGLLVISLLACFANPQFIKGALYPLHVFSSLGQSTHLFSNIEELQSPFSNGLFAVDEFFFYKVLVLLSLVALIQGKSKVQSIDVLLWSVFLLFSVVAIRNVMFFAVVAYILIMKNLIDDGKSPSNAFKLLGRTLVKILVVVYLLVRASTNLALLSEMPPEYTKAMKEGLLHKLYPLEGAEFLKNEKVSGHFFNDFNSGSFLLGVKYPDIKVFIDGRTEVYGLDFYKSYKDIMAGDVQKFEHVVQQYDLTGVFLSATTAAIPKPLLQHLSVSNEWSLVYWGRDSVIFLKNVPKNEDIINRNRVQIASYKNTKSIYNNIIIVYDDNQVDKNLMNL